MRNSDPKTTRAPVEPPHTFRHPVYPCLHLQFGQRFGTKRVCEAFEVILRVTQEHRATIERLFERQWKGKWSTHVGIQSQEGFTDETKARAWLHALTDRLCRELPHQGLLDGPLEPQRFCYTTAQAAELAGRLSSLFAIRGETIQDP